MAETKKGKGTLTIYDVAKSAGVSIASVSRVLNGQGSPRPETRDRVLRAVRELSFVPDGAARALSNGLKEVVAVVFRRGGEQLLEGEDETFLFLDVINRGIETAAQRRGFDLLISSVGFNDDNVETRISALAGKADGLILHDRMLSAVGIARLADAIPVVTLAGSPAPETINVRCDNEAGIRALVHHLVADHGYRSLGYVSGRADSPDNRTRTLSFETEAAAAGADFESGPDWQGNYSAAGGASVIASLLESGKKLPRAIVCANDQTALGVIHALARRGIKVPQDVAITGFDDVPVARHLHPPLTTVRQPMEILGTTAFDMVYSRINGLSTKTDVLLPVELVVRESCGCAHVPAAPARSTAGKRGPV
ncbi:MAG: LacI family DNA-binding transcriptional regulator [Candidatus Dormibacteraceae bacterium]